MNRRLLLSPDPANDPPAPEVPVNDPPVDPPADPPSVVDDKDKPTLTQKQVDTLVGAERVKARKTAYEDCFKIFGVQTLEELKTVATKVTTAETASQTALDALQAKLDEAETTNNTNLQTAKNHIIKLKIREEATKRGLSADNLLAFIESVGDLSRFEVDMETGEVKDLGKSIDAAQKINLTKGNPTRFLKQGAKKDEPPSEPDVKNAAKTVLKQIYAQPLKR